MEAVESGFEHGLSISPCNLCPRLCGALRSEGGQGFCGAGHTMRIARAALHFWEEPPLSGRDGSGAVFFSHCPLKCVYCQNGDIASGGTGWEVSEQSLAQICLNLQRQGALNVNFVTPTHYSLHIVQSVEQARQRGFNLPVVWNTSGYERVCAVEALEGTVDVFLADFKYSGPSLARRYSNAPDYDQVALEAIEAMVRVTGEERVCDTYNGQERLVRGTLVRHLLLPGALEHSMRCIQMLWNRFGDAIAYSIMNQYTPLAAAHVYERFPELAQTPSSHDYERLLDYADSLGIPDYFWQDGPAAEESFVPAWDGSGLFGA